MKKAKVEIVNKTEYRRTHGIKVTTEEAVFTIPVIDVRDGNPERNAVGIIQFNSNRRTGSRYMQPSYSVGGNSYQNSHKKDTNF